MQNFFALHHTLSLRLMLSFFQIDSRLEGGSHVQNYFGWITGVFRGGQVFVRGRGPTHRL
jgi:hypothetical protein